ncbi:MAG: GyrI-like domain-containing protein [Sedimenticola sp.]
MPLRKQTRDEHQVRINEVLFHIHADLSATHSVRGLADIACYSPFHFQRIFRQVTGESVNDYIRRSRLEWAANLLIFNPEASVMEVALECGFASNASFSHAFKERFGSSPMNWRRGGYDSLTDDLKRGWSQATDNPHHTYHRKTLERETKISLPKVHILQLPEQHVAYIRHVGYDLSIAPVWQRLTAWASEQGVDPLSQQMFGLLHSNPDLIPYDHCRYVACLTLPQAVFSHRGVGMMDIPGGLYASCRVEGGFGDLLYVMRALYREWLPESGYQARSIPPHANHLDNHFINATGHFCVDFRIPIVHK